MKTDPRITVRRVERIEPDYRPPRHRDPSPDGAPFDPEPVARPAEPRMASRQGHLNKVPVPVGAQLQFRQRGGTWADVGQPGTDIELRYVAARK